jgi:lipopolysaccharide transport system permease protein
MSTAADILQDHDCSHPGAHASGSPVEADELPVTVIERRAGLRLLDLGELWRYRELLVFLTWRDVMVRYKQTLLGAAWAIIQPLATMLVFSLCLGRIAGAADSAIPYPLFVFAGLLPWTFFANAISAAGQSIVGNQNLITKVYFPRLIVPMGAVGASAVDFLVAFLMLLALMLCYGTLPGWGLLAAPLLVLGLAATALGVGTFLCALTAAYRDFRYVVPFLVQLWMFATPSIYVQDSNALGGFTGAVQLVNPAHGYIANFRAAMLGGAWDLPALAMSVMLSVVLLAAGCAYFRQVERDFADII